MRLFVKNKKIWRAVIFSILIVAALQGAVFAQIYNGQNGLLGELDALPNNAILKISWRALNYAPPEYEGKIFPIQESKVFISLQTGGLPSGTVRWLFNNEERDEFYNKYNIITGVSTYLIGGNAYEIKAVYHTLAADKTYQTSLIIPIVTPQVVLVKKTNNIETPAGNALISSPNSQINLAAKAFFFNTLPDLLQWKWALNGRAIGGKPDASDHITILTPNKTTNGIITVNAGNQNTLLPEEAGATIKLFVK